MCFQLTCRCVLHDFPPEHIKGNPTGWFSMSPTTLTTVSVHASWSQKCDGLSPILVKSVWVWGDVEGDPLLLNTPFVVALSLY